MTPMTKTFRTALAAAAAVLALAAPQQAAAVSLGVKMACASDYYSYCSQHAVGSPGVRKCMRANGHNLSNRCVTALIKAGEVSKSEVERRVAAR
ncbi:hypothetical protein [Hyphomicrobium sp.]|uniref:hypothetical protein n=1 Tax=Hyphomicrobium sp. TaxID=82 RepID=UPI002CE95C51|nr:hypothetical protein [Hyphomicrobium sp.]HRQ26900.1 hypothetical protein [Hyphomicrobium sp.]